MTQQVVSTEFRAGAFDSVTQADRAIRQLMAAGFSKDHLAVICPANLTEHFRPETSQPEAPTADPASTIAVGGAVGATLGGLALVATVLTGGVAGAVAAAALVGGGAIAGGFSNLVASKGYEQEKDDRFKHAVERGQIVVGVEARGNSSPAQLADAQRILNEAGAKPL